MSQEIIKLAVSQGIWATLFVVLLLYVLKRNDLREDRAAEREEKIMACLADMSLIRKDVDCINDKVDQIQTNVTHLMGRTD